MTWLKKRQSQTMSADSIMRRMVFVTGFARGGTSWLRDCIGSHPDVAVLPVERTVFRDIQDPERIRRYFEVETAAVRDKGRWIVNKAPANAPFVGRAARSFPESRFIFIIRDPRDVLVSHQRGTQEWMKGRNSTVEGCMAKIRKYYEGWKDAAGLPNVMLVRYEDLHQSFPETLARIFAFIGAECDRELLLRIAAENDFSKQTNRPHREDRASARRKGVIGDWAIHLSEADVEWYRRSDYFTAMMAEHGYGWTALVYENIVSAMREGGVTFLTEDDLLRRQLDPERPNVAVQHDIDLLNEPWCEESVRRTAEIEAAIGVPAAYNFLPLDDMRYAGGGREAALRLIEQVRAINPQATIGLHLNACERFYPAAAPDAGNTPSDLDQILDYLRRQVAEFAAAGVTFRVATAHGYGRGKKLPNNRDTPVLAEELARLGITLFDTSIRQDLMRAASMHCAITDVGGTVKPRRIGTGDLTDAETYRRLPAGSFLRYLTHPGNYPVDRPATLAMRHFT